MIELDQALKIAATYVNDLQDKIGVSLHLLEQPIVEGDYGWVFGYNSKEYIETKRLSAALAGNAPIIVDRNTGLVTETGSVYSVDYYVNKYVNSAPEG